jgi:hypothetical protein
MALQTNLEALIEAAKHLSDEERKKLIEALHPSSDTPHATKSVPLPDSSG